MRYENMEPAIFLERPNRFVAYVEQAGRREICHVKNTGRCRELLVPGAELYVRAVGEYGFPGSEPGYGGVAEGRRAGNKGDSGAPRA